MNAPLRRVGVVIMLLFGLLFANLNWVQGYQATAYRTSDYNGRVQVAEYERPRGKVVVNGTPVASSKETTDELKFLRTYPTNALYAHIVGYKPVNGAATGIEKLENDFLSGTADQLFADRLRDLFTGKQTAGGNVELTLSKAAQEAAVKGLATNGRTSKGAVVALDPKTGKVLALVSMPSFDPNALVVHDGNAAQAAFDKLDQDPAKPLLNRALSETFQPGSTMKVVASLAALQAGMTPATVLTGGSSYTAPDTDHPIGNAPGVVCPQQLTLKQALTVSCNTAFARMCVEKLNADKVKAAAQALGFESEPRFTEDGNNVFRTEASHTGDIKDPDGTDDLPLLAQSCIGQADVRMTPMQGALIAAAVANYGTQLRPYLIEKRQSPDLTTMDTGQPKTLRESANAQAARDLQDMMISVVDKGTGQSAQIAGFRVGGKTGTAENEEKAGDHGWFIGFVMKGDVPIAAVAVLLERAGKGGSHEAASIAGDVMKAILAERGLR
ncbi:MAG TPA: penicillin-binding transpeptidase domain-containing protein [Micromonosporaceae bacterium]|jgi:peptidoglycan glycosyltransferase|nr:penicillin-binding transpeptidase domain-containing protein [Micromonosporaceae bacterium]